VNRTRAGRAAVGAVALLAVALVSGCGGDQPTSAPPTAPSASSTPPEPTATAPNDVKTTTTTSALPVPAGGPTEVANFPVPKGVRLKGPGPTARSWQFDIHTADTGSVLAFYRKALADKGYRVQNDVNLTIGIEKVHYDIQFSGPARGYIVSDKQAKDVFVLVESLPTSG
jgi:hypothetical protein